MAVLAASPGHFLVQSPSMPRPTTAASPLGEAAPLGSVRGLPAPRIVRLEAQAVPFGRGACASPAGPGPACAAEAPRRWPPLPAAALAWPGAAPAQAPLPTASPLPAQPQPLSGGTAARPTPSSGRRPVTLSRRAVAVVQGRPLGQAQEPLPSVQQVLPLSPRRAPAPAPLLPSPAPAAVVAAADFESRQTALVLGNPQVLERCAGLLFRKSDLNRDGRLSLDEFAQLLPSLHEQLGLRPPEHGDRLARARMRKFDRNGDGVLGEAEFVELYRWMLYRRYEELNPPKFRRGDVVGRAHRGVPSQYYEIGKQLGAGTFGVVSEVTQRQTRLQCVMKTVNKDKAAASGTPVALLKQEIDALSLLDHPNILRLFEWYNDHHNIYMLMDACKGGELLELILEFREGKGAMPEAWVSRIFRQMLEAIGYCHAQGVMHKDLKFENVMLREKVTRASSYHDIHAVVIDVGLAELFGPQHGRGSRSRQLAGSLATMAPEVIQGDFAYKCDIWSLGCMLFAIFNSRPFNIQGPNGQGQMLYMYPFYPTPTQEDPMGVQTLHAAQQKGPPMAQVAAVGPQAQQLILRMLQLSEQLRPTAQECLASPWLSDCPDGMPSGEVHFTQDLVNAISQEHEGRLLWRSTLLQAAAHLPGSKLEPLERIFEEMDVRKRGALDKAELAEALQRLGLDGERAARAADAADFDGDGLIEWSEFAALCLPASQELFAVSLQVAFQSFDENQDGVLEPSEVLALLQSGRVDAVHLPATKELEAMVAELDRDCNGKISFREFHDYFVRAHVDRPEA